jgi:hypothetical protein
MSVDLEELDVTGIWIREFIGLRNWEILTIANRPLEGCGRGNRYIDG